VREAALDHLVPDDPAVDDALRAALGRKAARRLDAALRSWRRLTGRAPARADLAGVAPASGRFRSWLAEVEESLALVQEAGRVRRRRGRGVSRLVAMAADAGRLAALAPRGRIPPDFARRAERDALRRLARSARVLPEPGRDLPGADRDPEIGGVLVERGLAIEDAGRDPRFVRRVAAALERLEGLWPEAAAMVRLRTWRVVPVTAWATVSYSSASQPGVAYINVKSAPLLRLAEDLLHETTHIRVHEIEAVHPLVSAGARETGEGGEPRFYSPWRREWRPLRGLVHAACTFTVGAMFFERALARSASAPSRRRWLARRLLEERASVAMALRALDGAGRRGMLTPAGRTLVAAVRAEQRRLAHSAATGRRGLAATRAGRLEIEKLERFVRALRARPVRWSWT